MGKKQSRAAWRKRGAPLEQAALQARRAADRERRTGGSLNAAVDGSLFELQPAAAAGAAKAVVGAPRVKAARQPQLWVERTLLAGAQELHQQSFARASSPTLQIDDD